RLGLPAAHQEPASVCRDNRRSRRLVFLKTLPIRHLQKCQYVSLHNGPPFRCLGCLTCRRHHITLVPCSPSLPISSTCPARPPLRFFPPRAIPSKIPPASITACSPSTMARPSLFLNPRCALWARSSRIRSSPRNLHLPSRL